MASYLKRLDDLLASAREQGLVDAETRAALRSLAERQQRGRGTLRLVGALGGLGGGVAALGVLLLVSAHWDAIPDLVKLGGLLLLLVAAHGLGLWLRFSGSSFHRTAEALHFLGAWLFLAGIALVAQIYHGLERTFHLAEWGVSMAAWIVWFLLALGCVGFGARSGRKNFLNLGVSAVGLGALTLFFDLMGSLATTGTIFLLGGVALLGTGWAMERWRRRIVRGMEQAA